MTTVDFERAFGVCLEREVVLSERRRARSGVEGQRMLHVGDPLLGCADYGKVTQLTQATPKSSASNSRFLQPDPE